MEKKEKMSWDGGGKLDKALRTVDTSDDGTVRGTNAGDSRD